MTTNYFKSTLGLVAAILVVELSLLLYLSSINVALSAGATYRAGIAIVMLFGLWLQSGAVRYLGALAFVAGLGTVTWAVLSRLHNVQNFWLVWLGVAGLLYLASLWILLLSRRFSMEFAYLRETQPAYKKVLRRLCDVVLIVAATAAALADVYQFARS
jgi:hypothetical protein